MPFSTPAAPPLVEVGDGLRGAFLDRCRRAIDALSRELDEASLRSAVAAPTDGAVLFAALRAGLGGGLGLEANADPLAEARLAGLRIAEGLLNAEGRPWSAQQAADHLGITRQAVVKRVKSHRLLAVDTGRHGQAYPVWQFVRGGVLPGLEATLALLAGHDAWMQLDFFLGPHAALDGRTPLEALRGGDHDAVARAARRFGEQGAD